MSFLLGINTICLIREINRIRQGINVTFDTMFIVGCIANYIGIGYIIYICVTMLKNL